MTDKTTVLSPETVKKLEGDAFQEASKNAGNNAQGIVEDFRNHPDHDGDGFDSALRKNTADFLQSIATLRKSIEPLKLSDYQNAGTILTNECKAGDRFLTRKADGTPALEELQGNNLTIFTLGTSEFEVVDADPNTVCSELVSNAVKVPQSKTPQK